MGEFAIGQSVLRREDPRLLRGRGRYFDDLKLADQLSRRDRALATRPRRHQRHRHTRRGAADAGRACRADRRGLSRRRHRLAAVDGAIQEARRRPDVPAAAAGDRRRPRVARRLSGRGGGRRHARSGARCRRARHGRLCAAARRGVGARSFGKDGAAALRRLPGQRGLFLPGRRQGQDRRRVRRPPRMWSSSALSSIASPPIRSSRAASPAYTMPVPAATRCIAASSGRGCSATTSPGPRSRFRRPSCGWSPATSAAPTACAVRSIRRSF